RRRGAHEDRRPGSRYSARGPRTESPLPGRGSRGLSCRSRLAGTRYFPGRTDGRHSLLPGRGRTVGTRRRPGRVRRSAVAAAGRIQQLLAQLRAVVVRRQLAGAAAVLVRPLAQRLEGGQRFPARPYVDEVLTDREVDARALTAVLDQLEARVDQAQRAGRGLAVLAEPDLPTARGLVAVLVRLVVGGLAGLGEADVAQRLGHQRRLSALAAGVEHPHRDLFRRDRIDVVQRVMAERGVDHAGWGGRGRITPDGLVDVAAVVEDFEPDQRRRAAENGDQDKRGQWS